MEEALFQTCDQLWLQTPFSSAQDVSLCLCSCFCSTSQHHIHYFDDFDQFLIDFDVGQPTLRGY